MNFNEHNRAAFTNDIKTLIIYLRRRKNIKDNWQKFKYLVENDPDFTCSALNTRWLVSVADTFADYGDELERRNALYISMLANFEKLAATRLLMYDLTINTQKLKKLKKNFNVPLWDGMHSFNINRGDMMNNLFFRIRRMMKETPVLADIFETVLNRMITNDTVLANINVYHNRLLANPEKRSLRKIVLKKIRLFFKNYRLL